MVGEKMRSSKEAGFTYLAVLFLVFMLGIVLAAMGTIWSTSQKRERERNLLFVGHQFRKAIGDYYQHTPGTVKRYPNSFGDLLKDNRQLATTRYLRRIYLDPMTSQSTWGIVRAPDGGIMGVYSLSAESTMKQSGFTQEDSGFENAKNYQGWRFSYEPPNLKSKS
jgi:type II secretory pathway pseudopilin PulG